MQHTIILNDENTRIPSWFYHEMLRITIPLYLYFQVVHVTLNVKVVVLNAIILFVSVLTKKKMISGTDVLIRMVRFWEDVLTIVKMTNLVKQFALLNSSKISKSVHVKLVNLYLFRGMARV